MGTFANDSTGSGSQSIGEQHMDIGTSQQFTPLTAEFRNTAAHAAQLAVDAVRNLSRSASPMIAQPRKILLHIFSCQKVMPAIVTHLPQHGR